MQDQPLEPGHVAIIDGLVGPPMRRLLSLLALAALSLIVPGLDPLWRDVALMMAALPTASNAFILASQYKAYIEGASTAVIISTIISGITIPLLIYVLQAS